MRGFSHPFCFQVWVVGLKTWCQFMYINIFRFEFKWIYLNWIYYSYVWHLKSSDVYQYFHCNKVSQNEVGYNCLYLKAGIELSRSLKVQNHGAWVLVLAAESKDFWLVFSYLSSFINLFQCVLSWHLDVSLLKIWLRTHTVFVITNFRFFSHIILDSSSVGRTSTLFWCWMHVQNSCWSHKFILVWMLVRPQTAQQVPELCN